MCGPGPNSIVATAALALAWSRYFSDVAAATGDAEMAIRAIRIGDASRTALLTAHELCAREAVARQATRPNGLQRLYAMTRAAPPPKEST